MIRKNQKKNSSVVEAQMSRRRLLKQGALLGGISAFASVFSLTPRVSEAYTSPRDKMSIIPIKGAAADRYIHTVLTSQEYKDFLKLAQAKGAPALQGSQPLVNLFSQGQTEIIYVSHSVRRGDEYSTYTVFFQPGSFTPTQAAGYLFVMVPGQSNIAVTGVTNGKEVVHTVITPDGKIVKGYKITVDGKRVTLDGLDLSQQSHTKVSSARPDALASCCDWCCMYNCLSNIGNIPNWVLYFAGVVCSVACLAPPACVVCLLGLGTITGFAITLCDENCCF
jgi:hypothetical protein